MSNAYVIQWKSKVNGRAGKGTKLFTQEEARRLVAELNREYPQIEHEAIPAAAPGEAASPVAVSATEAPESAAATKPEPEGPAEREQDRAASTHAFSLEE